MHNNPFVEQIELEKARQDYAALKARGDALRDRNRRDLARTSPFVRLMYKLGGIDMVEETTYVSYDERMAESRLRDLERQYGLVGKRPL